MAFVHCHNCGWEQDDFWDEKYSPLHGDHFEADRNWLMDAIKDPSKRILEFDSWWTKSVGLGNSGSVEIRELTANTLERKAKNIRSMKWMTYKDFNNDPDKKCPNCGSKDLNID